MTTDDKLALIAKFEGAYAILDDLLRGLDEAALSFLPAVPEAWSVNDHLVHLLDADTAVYFRIRASIAEPGCAIALWDENAWHERLAYGRVDGLGCLELAKGLRKTLGATLRALVDADWDGYKVLHPTRGEVRLVELLTVYRDHVAFHAPFVKRNKDAFAASRKA